MKTMKLLRLALLLVGLSVVGCDKPDASKPEVKKTVKAAPKKDVHDDHDHDHGDGPHGGLVLELGKYHGEFVVDHDKKQATVYILDGRVKNPVPIETAKFVLSIKSPQFQTDLIATPQESDPKGKSSRFVATHDNLGKVQEFEGTITGEIDGKPYSVNFKEEAHAEDAKSKK